MQIPKAVEWIRAAVLTCKKKGFMNGGAKSNSSSAAAS
jgi:hypothetical protein